MRIALNAPDPVGHEDLLVTLRAAGETTRLRILALLAESELTVKDLTSILGQSQPRISRHMKLLADARLVTRSAEGAFAYYRLEEDDLGRRRSQLILSQLDPSDPIHVRDRERREATRKANADAAAAYFAANAKAWDSIRSLHASDADVEAAIVTLLGDRPIHSMLDIGTGTGRMLELLSNRVQRALGVDASAAMLSVARANLDRAGIHNVRLAQDDVYALSLGDHQFDLVLIHQVLHYLDDPGRAVAEAARTLRPGGRMLVVDFAPHALEQLRTDAAHRRLGIGRVEMDDWLRTAGLDAVAVQDLAGKDDTLTVTLWVAQDPRIQSDDIRLPEGAYA